MIGTRCSLARRLLRATLTVGLLALLSTEAQAQGAEGLVRPPEPRPRPVETEVPDPPPGSFALARPLHLGVSGAGGAAISPMGSRGYSIQGFGRWGHSVSGTVHEHVSLAITRMGVGFGYSSIEGTLVSFQLTPVVELFEFVDRRVQLYVQLGAAFQGRTRTMASTGSFQATAHVAAGARLWPTDWFSIAAYVGADLVLTDAYWVFGASLPQLSVPLSLGAALEWHIAP